MKFIHIYKSEHAFFSALIYICPIISFQYFDLVISCDCPLVNAYHSRCGAYETLHFQGNLNKFKLFIWATQRLLSCQTFYSYLEITPPGNKELCFLSLFSSSFLKGSVFCLQFPETVDRFPFFLIVFILLFFIFFFVRGLFFKPPF